MSLTTSMAAVNKVEMGAVSHPVLFDMTEWKSGGRHPQHSTFKVVGVQV